MSNQPNEWTDAEFEAVTEIGGMVIEHAQFLFDCAGCHDDYCIQVVGSFRTVFGRTNHLLWSAPHGFVADKRHCTDKFINAVKERGVKTI